MQVFNLLNSRKIDETMNFFEGICSNSVFIFVWLTIFVSQIFLGQFGGVLFSVFRNGLDVTQWGIVIATGLLVIPINIVAKIIIFKVLKLGDGSDELEEEDEDEEDVKNINYNN